MRFGISIYCISRKIVSGEITPVQAYEKLCDYGAEAVELVPFGFNIAEDEKLIEDFKEAAERRHVPFTNYSLNGNFLGLTEEEFEAEINRAKKHMDAAAKLGAESQGNAGISFSIKGEQALATRDGVKYGQCRGIAAERRGVIAVLPIQRIGGLGGQQAGENLPCGGKRASVLLTEGKVGLGHDLLCLAIVASCPGHIQQEGGTCVVGLLLQGKGPLAEKGGIKARCLVLHDHRVVFSVTDVEGRGRGGVVIAEPLAALGQHGHVGLDARLLQQAADGFGQGIVICMTVSDE